MTERNSEQGIQAKPTSPADTRITAEEPLPEPPSQLHPTSQLPTRKPYHREHWLGILAAFSLVSAVVMTCFVILVPLGMPSQVWPIFIAENALGGTIFGCFIGVIFLPLQIVTEPLDRPAKAGDK